MVACKEGGRLPEFDGGVSDQHTGNQGSFDSGFEAASADGLGVLRGTVDFASRKFCFLESGLLDPTLEDKTCKCLEVIPAGTFNGTNGAGSEDGSTLVPAGCSSSLPDLDSHVHKMRSIHTFPIRAVHGSFGIEGSDNDANVNACPGLDNKGSGSGFFSLSDGNFRKQFLDGHAAGAFQAEVQACRWPEFDYGTTEEDVKIGSTHPAPGELLVVVGDHVVDLDHDSRAEIHETQGMVVRRDLDVTGDASPDHTDYHLLSNSFFLRTAAQQLRRVTATGEMRAVMEFLVPVPPPADGKKYFLEGFRHRDCSGTTAYREGCKRPPFVAVATHMEGLNADGTGSPNTVCVISVELRGPDMNFDPRDSCRDVCSSDRKKCVADAGGDPKVGLVHWTGDVAVKWVTPKAIVTCGNCSCGNPAAPAAASALPGSGLFTVGIQGCSDSVPEPTSSALAAVACNDVCLGSPCGLAPACRIGGCRPPTAASSASLLMRDACTTSALGPSPVSSVADWTFAAAESESFATVRMAVLGGATATTTLSGTVGFNSPSRHPGLGEAVEIVGMHLGGSAFSVGGFPVAGQLALNTDRIQGKVTAIAFSPVPFSIPIGSARFVAQFTVAATPVTLPVANKEEPLLGFFDADAGELILQGHGTDQFGDSLDVRFVGHVINRPPTAVARGDGVVECSGGLSASVHLDGRSSSDPEDPIAAYQWFDEDERGLSIEAEPTVTLPLGTHDVRLHVYDPTLASAMTHLAVTVRDTRGPVLSADASPTCLWPPNHKMVLFRLGNGLDAHALDTCDPSPSIRVVGVSSNQPASAPGSGSTGPDLIFGPTAACLRAERSGTSKEARVYTLTLEAADRAGNKTRRDVIVRVPHDLGGGERKVCPNVDSSRVVPDTDPRCKS